MLHKEQEQSKKSTQKFECDNIRYCHEPIVLNDDTNAMRVFCTLCKNQYIIRKDWRGVPENKTYSKIFRKEILQPNTNLFYKYYPQHMRT